MNVQQRNHTDYSSGQALAELIIACAILAIVLFGVVSTINFSLNAVSVSTNKTRANYYAQEGLERARAARNEDWDTFTGNTNGTVFLNNENDRPIAGTIFNRTIRIEDGGIAGNNERRVTSMVEWFDGTEPYQTQLVTILTNH